MPPDQPQPRITLRDIARQLGVSHTTVSRALRDDPQISQTMREQVRNAVQKTGYRPDPMLSALAHYRRGRTQTPIGAELALINHWPNPGELWSYREFALYRKGALEEAERCGFRLEEFVLDNKLSPARLEKILRARNIRGLLLPPSGDVGPDYENLHWDNYCIVRFGHSIPFPHAHMVTSDQLTDGLIAFENMWKNGYRRIGLATSSKMHTRFSAGFYLGQMRWSPDVRLPVLVVTQKSNKEDRRLLKSWLKTNKPDAILTDQGELRVSLQTIGYKIPKDVGLAALSVLDGNADAGIDQNSEEIGKVAIQLLISLINHNECGIPKVCREVLVEGEWVNGSTLPPRD
jgi:DNA-binding LacI/PurR family transcriptional regulator